MPEWIVFQELMDQQVLEAPMSVAAMVVMADDHAAAVEAASGVGAFMAGAVIGAVQIDDRKAYEVAANPTITEKKKPKK